VTEFRISSNHALRESNLLLRVRAILWSIVVALIVIPVSAIALFVHYGDRTPGYLAPTTFAWLSALLVAAAIGAVYFAAYQNGLQKLKRETAFALTDHDLIRKRSGWPDTRIGLSEVKTLYERNGWLIVESMEPGRKIAISDEVEGFATLRAELAKHISISDPPKASPLTLLGFVLPLTSILCWSLVLMSHDVAVVRETGAGVLILLGWSSYLFGRKLRQHPKRFLVWTFLAITWAAALWFVYLHITRLHS
jgi:hypothetical protein